MRLPYKILLYLTFLSTVAQAQLADVPDGKDHPLISRYQGSTLVAAEIKPFDANILHTSYDGDEAKDQTIEGSRTRLVYIAPQGRSAYEVQRNYEQALQHAGALRLLSCLPKQSCVNKVYGQHQEYVGWMQPLNEKFRTDVAFSALNDLYQNQHHSLFKLNRAGDTHYISILTSDDDGNAAEPLTGRAVTVLEIIQPTSMDTGKVVFTNADAINKGLTAEGKMTLYGIFFDTGKADIKPESKNQLAEMAKVLAANKALNVFIVGHTDNQGSLDSNLPLSQKRAEAIVAALVKDYKIDTRRLTAKGVANFAPIASHNTEAGRTKNRRVEMVAQ